MTDENVRAALDESAKLAKEMEAEEKIRNVLNDAENKLGEFPKMEGIKGEVETIIALLKDYVDKKYTDIPFDKMTTLLGTLLHMVKPIDLIPDSIPVIGQADDVAIMKMALKVCGGEIEKYKAWRVNPTTEITDAGDQ